jgi:hypothetical protein
MPGDNECSPIPESAIAEMVMASLVERASATATAEENAEV